MGPLLILLRHCDHDWWQFVSGQFHCFTNIILFRLDTGQLDHPSSFRVQNFPELQAHTHNTRTHTGTHTKVIIRIENKSEPNWQKKTLSQTSLVPVSKTQRHADTVVLRKHC